MELWILKPLPIPAKKDDPWEPWYDKTFGFVVRAISEWDAREIAAKNCGDEGDLVWLDPAYSACDELTADGEAGVVLVDHANG